MIKTELTEFSQRIIHFEQFVGPLSQIKQQQLSWYGTTRIHSSPDQNIYAALIQNLWVGVTTTELCPRCILGIVIVCAFVCHRRFYLVTSLPLSQYSLNSTHPGQ